MARLEYVITGTNTGLANAASQSIGILQNLQKAADALKIKFFQAEDVQTLNSIGGALQAVTGKITAYTTAAIKGSDAFQGQQVQAALDALSIKLNILNGNAQLFGSTIVNQQNQVKAYQDTINKLLSAGLDPLDGKIQTLKGSINSLTDAIQSQKAASVSIADPFEKFVATGSLIKDAESRVRNLGDALKNATDTRSIAQYNLRLLEAQKDLTQLKSIGLQTAASQNTLAQSAQNVGRQFNGVGLEFGRIIQDAPFAANNFGAVGNNITRLTELLPGFKIQLQEIGEAQKNAGQAVTPFKNALGLLTGGFAGVSLAISVAVSAFVFYQQYQQKAARDAEDGATALQKQKKALDDYILSLSAVQRASAGAADSYSKEVTKLDILYASLVKNSDARYGNVTALQELQKSWPEEFGNLEKGEILTNKVTEAYNNLRQSLIQTAVAQAAQSLSADETKKLVENTVALSGATERAKKDYAELIALQQKRNDLIAAANKGQQFTGKNEDISVAIANTTVAYNDLAKQVRADIAQQKEYQDATVQSSKKIQDFNKAAQDAQNLIKTPVESGLVLDLETEIKRLQSIQPFIKDRIALEQNVADIKAKQAQLDELLGRNIKTNNKALEHQLSLQQQLEAILAKSAFTTNKSGLEGYFLEIQNITENYVKLNTELDNFNAKVLAQEKIFKNTNGRQGISPAKGDKLISQSNSGRTILDTNQAKEFSDAAIKEAERVSNEIQRINDEFGVRSEESKAKELSSIQARYDAEVVKAKSNKEILTALDQDRLAAIQAVNEKYLAIENDLYAKIADIDSQAQADITGSNESQTQKIQNEWNKRIAAANKYYDALIAIKLADPTLNLTEKLLAAGKLQGQKRTTADKGQQAANADIIRANVKPFTDAIGRGLDSATRGIYEIFSTINEQVDQSFGNIFSTLVSKVDTTFNQIFLDLLSKKLTQSLTDSFVNSAAKAGSTLTDSLSTAAGSVKTPLSNALVGALAAAGLVGGLISGATAKTSSVGQGVGGALSGAATGAAVGALAGPPSILAGAIIGGVVGLVGGLFGAASARKKAQETADAQLEQAKQQTALLRQQALAYTSSIIGRMTNQGIVTAADINSFGQLTATIDGRSLKLVLGRAASR
ncbi:MAG TPA: hypothetical protein VHA52_04650 [Candidatus Babeliaceae bacterium]|nr:hypothetical protein [Candidatus Babeliaceae bacterium]